MYEGMCWSCAGKDGSCSHGLGATLSESLGALSEKEPGYTVVGVLEDGVGLNQAVSNLRELGIRGDELTVILKRGDPDVPEPFPEGTRYIVVPDDLRGLEIPIGFAAIFVVASLLFAFTAPGIGTMVFVFFSVIAAILAAGAFTSVGVTRFLWRWRRPRKSQVPGMTRSKGVRFSSLPARPTAGPSGPSGRPCKGKELTFT